MQNRIRYRAFVIAAGETRAPSHESAVFKPDLHLRYVDAGMVFAYVNHFDTLYRDVTHFRA